MHFDKEDHPEPDEKAAYSWYLRCLHTEYGRPPSEQDAAAGERHWRCPATFRFVSYVEEPDLPIGDRAYCAAHRWRYAPGEPSRRPTQP